LSFADRAGSSLELTRALGLLARGEADPPAAQQVFSAAYSELHRLASGLMRRERGNHTLSATALVHEAYLRLVDQTLSSVEGRAHFYGIAARAMRQILVDHARRRSAGKRGGHWDRVTLDENLAGEGLRDLDLLAVDDAITKLNTHDERAARVVELKFFAGLTNAEAAQVLAVSERTVDTDWKLARLWLKRALSESPGP